jgi:BirA family transcriptional regulator, biotin operon repressor / biotin---[acetyl-CoA-carboxylase] ligase
MIKQIHLKQCNSTQDILKEQLTNDPREGVLVSTDQQLQGRGRGTNSWQSLPGSLCFSLSLKSHPTTSLSALEVSLLLVDYFKLKNVELQLKWPNDLWNLHKKKCGGVLLQGSKEIYLAGIGLNLYSEDSDFGGIFQEEIDSDKKVLAQEISQFILSHRVQDKSNLQERWLSVCGHLNSAVEMTEGDMKSTGIFKGIGDHGEAILETDEGLKQFFNGSLRLRNDSLGDGI